VRESLQPKDIPTEIVPLIAAINQLVERYRQALETQRRFVADAAHELRTPLAALQIQTDNLLASDLSKQSRELANELGDGVRRSSHLAHQLLEMARSEGSPAVCNRTIDLAALITSILTEFVTLACASGIHLERDIVNPASVDSDDTAVRKILSILIDNAICYSSRDSVVTVKLSLIENQPRIDVMDSGAGIPIDALPFIYDRFYRGASQEIEGSGLGLAIAKAAADRNNIRLLHQRRTDVQGTVATMVFNQCSAELELSDLSVSAVDSSFGTG
jgi:two-component system OmpR family sensor kinase